MATGQLCAYTHLLLSTDIADDGVGGRAGRGAEDCHHPFRHDLAHWEKIEKGWRGEGRGDRDSERETMSVSVCVFSQILMDADADYLNL